MLQFFSRRAVSLVFVLFSLTFLTFAIGRLAPGDPILVLMGQRRDPATYARLQHLYGLDRPLLDQYFGYVAGLLRGDFGLSFQYEGRPVRDLIESGVGISLLVGGLALLLSILAGVPLGMLAALRQHSLADRGIVGVSLALYSVPSFVLIPLLWALNLAAYRAGLPSLPQAGWGRPEHFVLPVLVLAAANIGYIIQLTRSAMLEVLREDYVRTARSKGLPNLLVINRHVLRNALLPLITFVGPAAAFLVTGAFVVEVLFNIPGMGRIAVEAVGRRDYPVIQGTTIILGIAVVLMNLVSDLLYHVFDPRIQLGDT
ncbi:MAG TPA: ABC transporter permease [Kouleothrix sp.]|nr:ABC transporter permease [Kouleothrix sp.]HRC75348.1 ABC transporter permease [Kouleothrix sp.]